MPDAKTTDPKSEEARALRKRMRSAARLYAVQALFQMEAAGHSLDRVRAEFESHRFGMDLDGIEMSEGDADHFRSVLTEAVSRQAKIDQMADRALVVTWPINRIDPVLRALFRAAGAELAMGNAPPKVVIAEYMQVASAFAPEGPDGREIGFVNAVLDHMAREADPAAFV